MSSPLPTLSLILMYLIVVWYGVRQRHVLPKFQLRPLLVVYNGGMAALNAYIFSEIVQHSRTLSYDWTCQPVRYSTDPHEHGIAEALWWYYISKLLEFLDTMFFIARGRFRQISFLHVYHHSTMFGFWWIGVKWEAGGSAALGAATNAFVHILMYSYYGLSAMFPRRDFWWKKYLTVIQLFQFCLGLSVGLGMYFRTPRCPFPLWMYHGFVLYVGSILLLFGNFWLRNYSASSRKLAADDRKMEGTAKKTVDKYTDQMTLIPYRCLNAWLKIIRCGRSDD